MLLNRLVGDDEDAESGGISKLYDEGQWRFAGNKDEDFIDAGSGVSMKKDFGFPLGDAKGDIHSLPAPLIPDWEDEVSGDRSKLTGDDVVLDRGSLATNDTLATLVSRLVGEVAVIVEFR